MEPAVNLTQPAPCHVRVNLRGVDLRVTEHLLDHAQVRAVLQKMRGKAMTQHVRRNIPLNARAIQPPPQILPHDLTTEGPTALGEKNIGRRFGRDEFKSRRAE